jgi:integrase
LDKFDPVQSWIANVAYSHSPSKNTCYKYKHSLETFSLYIGKSVAEILADYSAMDEKEFKRTYAQYLKSYIAQLSNDNYAANSINATIASIKSFFKYSDLPLGFVPIGNKRVVYHNRDITKEEVLAVLAASKPRERAFFCMMAQSGLRPDTLIKLKLKDIEPDFSKGVVPCAILVSETNTKGNYSNYCSFMGEESINYLKAYFSSERPNIKPDDPIFKLHGKGRNAAKKDKVASPKSFSILFANTLKQLMESRILTYDKRIGKPSELRLYTLRKYFRRCAGEAGKDWVNYWMGHVSELGVDLNYMTKGIEYHRKQYTEKAMLHLRLESSTASENDKEKTQKIELLNKQVANLTATVENLQRVVEIQSKHIERTQSPTIEQDVKLKTAQQLLADKGINIDEFAALVAKALSSASSDKK